MGSRTILDLPKKEDPYHPTLTRTIVQINRKCPVQKMTIREP